MTKEERKEYSHNRYLVHHEEIDIHNRAWARAHPEKVRDSNLKQHYGITRMEYDELFLSQGGKCAICGADNSGTRDISGKSQPMLIDHDHITGKIRGLLCHKCN